MNSIKLRTKVEVRGIGKVIDNLFFNNYFSGNIDNVKQLDDGDPSQQQWNIEKTPGLTIIGGPYLSGNYWDDYAGNDSDGNGLGDTPYEIINGVAWDYLPLYNSPHEKPTINDHIFKKQLFGFFLTFSDRLYTFKDNISVDDL